MIVTQNIPQQTFESLLHNVKEKLTIAALDDFDYFINRNAQKLEEDIFEYLKEASKGTLFEKRIELVSGFRFPDIVARLKEREGFGLEVKTTKKNDWRCIGNSVLESTRERDIDRIYIFFGKLSEQIEFKARLYQECLYDVAVTHSPRYKINMDLPLGESIFDKMNCHYDRFRNLSSPIKKIVEYYKTNLNEGESLWWIADNEDDDSNLNANLKISLFGSLDRASQEDLKIKALCLFPEILSSQQNKYYRMTLWLLQQGIADPCLRDRFSAGGRRDIRIGSKIFRKVPPKVFNILKSSNIIKDCLFNMDENLLEEHWGCSINNKLETWVYLLDKDRDVSNSFDTQGESFLNIFNFSLDMNIAIL